MQPKLLAFKIRSNLLEQKKRLENYLEILNKEEDDIINDDCDKLIAHIDLEKNIISEITSFRKILDPLEVIYYNSPYKKDGEIPGIKNNIDNLLNNVKTKSLHNREKLEIAMDKVKTKIDNINKKGLIKSAYNNVESRVLDLNG